MEGGLRSGVSRRGDLALIRSDFGAMTVWESGATKIRAEVQGAGRAGGVAGFRASRRSDLCDN
jgi:hypothetical protein